MADYYSDKSFELFNSKGEELKLGPLTQKILSMLPYFTGDRGFIPSDYSYGFDGCELVDTLAEELGVLVPEKREEYSLLDLLEDAKAISPHLVTEEMVRAAEEVMDAEADGRDPVNIRDIINIFSKEPGSNLDTITMTGAYTCSKPRSDGFGGYVEVTSPGYSYATDTWWLQDMHADIASAVGKDLIDIAATRIHGHVKSIIGSISDVKKRHEVQRSVGAGLLTDYHGFNSAHAMTEQDPQINLKTIADNLENYQCDLEFRSDLARDKLAEVQQLIVEEEMDNLLFTTEM